MTSTPRTPAAPARTFWPLGILLAFILFAVGTAVLIVLAYAERNELVTRDYYEQELRYQTRLDGLVRAQRLSARAILTHDAGQQRIELVLPPDHARLKPKGVLQLYRPSAAGLDRRVELAPDAEGRQSLDLSELSPGLWKVRLTWTAEAQEFVLEQSITNRSPGDTVPRR